VCDTIIIPAVLRANEDHDHGTLLDERRQTILEHLNDWVDEQLELMAPVTSRFANVERPETPPDIVCVPAAGRADEIIAKLFQAALLERNLRARIIGPNDVEFLKGERRARAIVISALPPGVVTAARATCKRMRMENTETAIFVGLWNASGDVERAKQRLTAAGATQTAVTFAECVALLDGVVTPQKSREPEGLAALSH
jgi:hypothetical protein